MSPDPTGVAVRGAIIEAMTRLLEGRPTRSDGKLTIKSLAVEAGVGRWMLTEKHTDLRDSFYGHVGDQGGATDIDNKLQAEIDGLRLRVKALSEERSALHATVDRFARIIQVVTLENEELKASANRSGGGLALVPNATPPPSP